VRISLASDVAGQQPRGLMSEGTNSKFHATNRNVNCLTVCHKLKMGFLILFSLLSTHYYIKLLYFFLCIYFITLKDFSG